MLLEQHWPGSAEGLPVFSPEVFIGTTDEADWKGFSLLSQLIRQKPSSVGVPATGSTWLKVYAMLADSGMDFSRLKTKNLDEYWGLPSGHPQSYAQEMKNNLFRHVNILPENTFLPNTSAPDPYEEAKRYQKVVDDLGLADWTILGIGPGLTCHIAFNERGSTLNSRVRVVEIDQETIKANAIKFFGGRTENVPRLAITQGVADILNSNRIILMAKGIEKAEGIRRTLEGPINSDAPASFLRLHPNVTFVLDHEAASLLSRNNA